MIAHVITLLNLPQSVEAATRCIASAATHGIDARLWPAHTPEEGPDIFRVHGWPTAAFTRNRYSRPGPCMACFASHAAIWELIARTGKPAIICEHDAVFVRSLPDLSISSYLVNLGRPSFGKFKQPGHGIGPLVSKPHLPGAHCYFLKPAGAKELLRLAKTAAEPTDVFIHTKRFPWLREAYPWPAECHETFSTVQREEGCAAKHRPVVLV